MLLLLAIAAAQESGLDPAVAAEAASGASDLLNLTLGEALTLALGPGGLGIGGTLGFQWLRSRLQGGEPAETKSLPRPEGWHEMVDAAAKVPAMDEQLRAVAGKIEAIHASLLGPDRARQEGRDEAAQETRDRQLADIHAAMLPLTQQFSDLTQALRAQSKDRHDAG